MMRYAYCHLTNSESEDAYSLLNIWQISEPAHAEVLEVVIPKEDMENMAFLICLDLAHPDTVEDEFKQWMETVAKIQNTLIGRVGSQRRKEIEDKLADHIQQYVHPADDLPNPADEEEEEEEDSAPADGAAVDGRFRRADYNSHRWTFSKSERVRAIYDGELSIKLHAR